MGRDKATMPHPERPDLTMVEHTVVALAGRCAAVFVIAAPGQRLPALDARIIDDPARGVGPLLATGVGLRAAAAAGFERAFVSAVDMPNLTADLVDQLAVHHEADVVLPWDGRDHYLAAIYRTGLAERIDVLVEAGHRSMRSLTATVVAQRVVLPPGRALTNVNAPSDLRH
jgi:molybdopterin-guanine dinucleotide biosynthesis protein A